MTIQRLINSWAASDPEQTYLISPETGSNVSFERLKGHVIELSAHLDALGIGKGEHVAVLMDNGPWTTILFLAIMASGRVVVPLNAIAGDSQLQYVLEHSDAALLLASEQHLARARKISDKTERDITLIFTSPDTGPDWPGHARAGHSIPPEVAPNDVALLIYTSGTTGKPKGVLLTHGNVIAGGMNTVEAHSLRREDRALCVLPLYHINAEIVTVIAPLISGGSVVMPHRFSTRVFWDLVRDHNCTWFSVVPTIVAYLLEHGDTQPGGIRGNPDYAHVRFGRSASSALPASNHVAFEKAFGMPLIETMGLSETAAQILSNPLPPGRIKYGSPGIAYRNEVKVIDENGRDVPSGEIGQIVVRGNNVMKGYYKNPKATAESLKPDGWLHTGDLGYRDADGFYFITGRTKELIIKGGENIAPREIDDVLLKHPAVLEAAAFAEPDRNYGQEVAACLVLKSGKSATVEEIRAFCHEELGKFKTPKDIHIVQWLPKGPSGKVQRLKIAEMLDQLNSREAPVANGA
ncbi:MAG: AMP-binding protein [Aquisalimonadaceae bacterium]